MEGTDVYRYRDGNRNNDHTSYGNGCPNDWGTDGDGGSGTSCDTKLVSTSDAEMQTIGVYYTFQAATSGTGAGMSTNNSNSPDTFCPLGWQLPYDGTGGDYYDKSRSWRYLFTTYNIAIINGTASDSTKIKSYPFSYVQSGYYHQSIGKLYLQNHAGFYRSSTVADTGRTYWLNIYNLFKLEGSNMVASVALRCSLLFSILHRRHGGRNASRFDSVY